MFLKEVDFAKQKTEDCNRKYIFLFRFKGVRLVTFVIRYKSNQKNFLALSTPQRLTDFTPLGRRNTKSVFRHRNGY